MRFKNCWIFILFLFLTGCIQPQYALKVKFVSLDGSLQKGTSIGPIRGEDCTFSIFGYQLGRAPTLDQALINASTRATSVLAKSGFMSTSADSREDLLRYISNMHTEPSGFDAYIIANTCITVTGVGYK